MQVRGSGTGNDSNNDSGRVQIRLWRHRWHDSTAQNAHPCHEFKPPGIYAGGLRYHGLAPTLSVLVDHGIVEPRTCSEQDAFSAGLLFARTEGIMPAPEFNHAVKAAIDSALEAKKNKQEKTIVFNLSGHGFFDMTAYQHFI